MTGFQQVTIGGYPSGGLTTDRKPMMLADQAFSNLQNAYVFRERTKKREGLTGMGRLQRIFTSSSLGTSGASPWSFNIYSTLAVPITPETNAQINPGSVTITIGTYVFKDQGNGLLGLTGTITGATQAANCQITSTAHHLVTGDIVTISGVVGMTQLNGNSYTITVVNANHFNLNVNSTTFSPYISGGTWVSTQFSNFGTINYLTGNVVITTTVAAGTAATITFGYYPGLPVMGINKRDIASIGIDLTVFFDTVYAYQFTNHVFQELLPGTTWSAPNQANGTNTNYFWSTNYQGVTPDLKYFFVTNDNINVAASTFDPIRYLIQDASAWLPLTPAVDASNFLFQAQIIIPYYGRLLALNTWEGTAVSPGNCFNYFSRVRFSQIGNPLGTNSWRSDMFGLGGFLDAPTNEAIVGAAFFRNTLIVFFEYSTWQLRYIGEYGLPFIFERISSDFGSVSTFSPIIFDQGVMAVSDRGIIQASAGGVTRLDEQIPETVFSFEIQNEAPSFVHGVRDFEKELVYWNYLDKSTATLEQEWPNTTLLFNYKNNTWAQFRDTITCFGIGQFQLGITWDSVTTLWDDGNVLWDSSDDQDYVDYVTAGSQHGFVAIYENDEADPQVAQVTNYASMLFIAGITTSNTLPAVFNVPLHNLQNDEFVYIAGSIFTGTNPGINNFIYKVSVVDINNITLSQYIGTNYVPLIIPIASTYIGGGTLALLPKMNIVGKDFNPFQQAGKQFKLSYIDFQLDSSYTYPSVPATTVQLFVNSFLGMQANLEIKSTNMELINSSQDYGFIEFASQANPCQITSVDHSLQTGDQIYISGVVGMTQLNQIEYIITIIDANNFTLNGVDSSGFSAYKNSGSWLTLATDGQVYISGSQYAWYRFYSTQFGQYLRIGLTYDDSLMNQVSTHQLPFELNAMNVWFREGGRIIN